jgi:hypothetical protein
MQNHLETQLGIVHHVKMQRCLIEIGQLHQYSEQICTVARPTFSVGITI